MARRKKKLPQEPIDIRIESLSHDGRGIAHNDGKIAFVEAGLPGENVRAKYLDRRSRYDDLVVTEVLEAGANRVEPPCAHADMCGGCSMQHLQTDEQILHKQSVLLEQFEHFGKLKPNELAEPMQGQTLGYRTKARLGVRYVSKRDEVLVGFRERHSHFITAIKSCPILIPKVGQSIEALKKMLHDLSVFQHIPQIEVAAGDEACSLIFRHLLPLTHEDLSLLCDFGERHEFHIYLQPKGPATVHRIWPTPLSESGANDRLTYALADYDLKMHFHPMDFTQVNREINCRMINQALNWLEPGENDNILDLFCGLGNFTLPLALKAKRVVGVEGEDAMVKRGYENAEFNGIANVAFHAADLHDEFSKSEWVGSYDKILLDPPRSGAEEVVKQISRFAADRIVYVSCNPATLARDAGHLVRQGYTLAKTGVMDMFPHTTHVESMALFIKST